MFFTSLLNEYDVLAKDAVEKVEAVLKMEKPDGAVIFDALDALYEQKLRLEEILWEIECGRVYEWALLSGLGARWGFREEDYGRSTTTVRPQGGSCPCPTSPSRCSISGSEPASR